MSRKQKLKNAVILGVMLSSITAGSVWAAEELPVYVTGREDKVEYSGDVVIESSTPFENGFISGLGAQGLVSGDWPFYKGHDATLTIPEGNIDNLAITVGNMGADGNAIGNAVAGIVAGGESKWGKNSFGTVNIKVEDALVINATTYNEKEGYGILAQTNGVVNVTAGSVEINASKGQMEGHDYGSGDVYGVKADGTVTLTATTGDVVINAAYKGIEAAADGTKTADAAVNTIDGNSVSADGVTINAEKGNISLNAIADKGSATGAKDSILNAAGDVYVKATSNGGSAEGVIGQSVTAQTGSINIEAIAGNGSATGVKDSVLNAAGDIYVKAEANGGSAQAINGGSITAGNVTGIATSSMNLDVFNEVGNIKIDPEKPWEVIGKIPEIVGAFGDLADVFKPTVGIGDTEITAAGDVKGTAGRILGSAAGIDNDKNITATKNEITGVGGNVTGIAGTVLGNATGITGNGMIKADGDVTGIAGAGTGAGVLLDNVGFNNTVNAILEVINKVSPDASEELKKIIDELTSTVGINGDAVGIKDKTIDAGGSVNGIAGTITGAATGIINGDKNSSETDPLTEITAGKDVNGMAGSLLGSATGIENNDSGAITATNGNVTGVAVSGLGTGNIMDLVGLTGLLDKIEDEKIRELIEGILDKVGTDSTAIGIDNIGSITAENGTMLGMAGSIGGDAIGIKNDADGIIDAKNVTGIAGTVSGTATGIDGTSVTTGTITAVENVVGVADSISGTAIAINGGNIDAKNVIAQAGSFSGDATGINGGTVTSDNVTGVAVTGKDLDELLKDFDFAYKIGLAADGEQGAGNAIGINGGTINATGTVTGVAGSIGGNATGINNAEIGSNEKAAEKVIGIADTVKGNAIGINGGTINAKDIIGQAASVDGNATGITSEGALTAAGSVVGIADTIDGVANGIIASNISAGSVFGQAGSHNGDATAVNSTNSIKATNGSVIGMAGSVKGAATAITGTEIKASEEIIGMAASFKGVVTGVQGSSVEATNGNLTGIAGSYNGNAHGVISTDNITAGGSVTGIAVTGKDLAELVKDFENLNIKDVELTADGELTGLAVGIEGGNITANNGNVYGMAGSYGGDATGIKGNGTITAENGSVIGMANSFKGEAVGITGTSVTAYDVIGQASSHDGNATAITSEGDINAAGIVTGLAGSVKGEANGIIASNIEAYDVFAQAGSVDGAATAITSTGTGADNGSITATGGNVIGMAGSVYDAATAITGGNIKAGSEIIGMATSFSGDVIGVQGGTIDAVGSVTGVVGSYSGNANGIISAGTITAGGNVTGMAVTGEEIAALLQNFENLNVKDIELTEDEILKGSGIATGIESDGDITAGGSVIGVGVSIAGRAVGIEGNGNITAGDSVIATANSIKGNAAAIVGADEKIITAGDSVIAQAGSVDGDAVGIYGDRVITAGSSNIVTAGSVNGDAVGIYGGSKLTAGNSNIVVAASKDGDSYGLYVDGADHSNVLDAAVDNVIYGGNAGIKVFNGGEVKLDADNINVIVAEKSRNDVTAENEHYNAVSVGAGSNFTANSAMNIMRAGEVDADGFGSETAVSVVGDDDKLANLVLNGSGGNIVQGAVYTQNGNVNITTAAGSNVIYSAAHGYTTGGDGSQHLVSALYAAENASITLSAENGVNVIKSSVDFVHDNDREITVWAENGGNVNIKGAVDIESSNHANYYEDGINGNALGIAISAGGRELATDNDGHMITPDEWGKVNIDYSSNVQQTSRIIGDIVAGYGGEVNVGQNLAADLLNGQIISTGGDSKLYMEGNALAGNGGKLNLDLGNGGVWYGRADNYGDAGYGKNATNHTNFYNPAFSNEIIEGGTVNIKMNDGLWVLTGQSWVSELNASGSIIDMAGQYISEENKEMFDMEHTHALVVDNFKGNNSTFIMDLKSDDVVNSDMLYIKNNEGTFDIKLANALDEVALDEIGELRFATIHGQVPDFGNGISQWDRPTVMYAGSTFNDVVYEVGSEKFNKEDIDNGIYNEGKQTNIKADASETENAGSFENGKPGEDYINSSFENGDTNLIITGVAGRNTGKIGQTIVDMSKANYTNAIYMDRLNKRMGETRFIDGDEGMWVRLRHDRIGKEDSFRSMNTMYEMGYDVKQEKDNGEHRVGFAIDYMDGSTSYSKLGGDGDISRKGIWMYDT